MNLIISFCYDLLLHLYVLVSLPAIFLRYGKYRGTLLKKLGFGFPKIDKKERKLVWVHAVSLGETKVAALLINKLKQLDPPPLVLLTSSTKTGLAEGALSEADVCAFLPLDISYVISPIVRRIAPDLVLATETDFWLHFQMAAKKSGAKICVINGKLSERSFKRFSRLKAFSGRLFLPIDHFFVQGELYKRRFLQLGVTEDRLTIAGNLKLDSPIGRENGPYLKTLLTLSTEPILTLGSTHYPEEALLLDALEEVWQRHPDLKVLLVPRHPERFDEVARLLTTRGLPFVRLSEKRALGDARVVLVDAMGVLKSCYQISTLAFVGGSLTPKVGGHNILEPGLYGKPVLFGSYMHSQPDFLELALSNNVGLRLEPERLADGICALLADPRLCAQMGENGRALYRSARGALEQIFSALRPLL